MTRILFYEESDRAEDIIKLRSGGNRTKKMLRLHASDIEDDATCSTWFVGSR